MLSVLFFGTTVAVALALPLAAALLLDGLGRGRRRGVIVVSAGVLGLYLLLQALGSRAYGAPNIPVDVVRWCARSPVRVVTTGVQLVRVGVASLLSGGWWQPSGRSDLLSWLVLAGGVGGLMTAFGMASSQRRRVLLAFTVLALAVYALVALARGPAAEFIWGIPATEVAARLRYHYIAQAFLAVALCVAIDAVSRSGHSTLAGAEAGCWAVVLAAGALVNPVSVDRHDAARIEVARALGSLHEELAAARPGQAVYILQRAHRRVWLDAELGRQTSGLAALFLIAVQPDGLGGRRVQFIETNPAVLDKFARPGVRWRIYSCGRHARIDEPRALTGGDGYALPWPHLGCTRRPVTVWHPGAERSHRAEVEMGPL